MRVSKSGVVRGSRGSRAGIKARVTAHYGTDGLRLARLGGLVVQTERGTVQPGTVNSQTAKACKASLAGQAVEDRSTAEGYRIVTARVNTRDHNTSRVSRDNADALNLAEFEAGIIITDNPPE